MLEAFFESPYPYLAAVLIGAVLGVVRGWVQRSSIGFDMSLLALGLVAMFIIAALGSHDIAKWAMLAMVSGIGFVATRLAFEP